MHNPLHIYISALPFTPLDTAFRKAYIALFSDIPQVVTGLNLHWPAESIFHGPRFPYFHKSKDTSTGSITFSSDGSRLAVSSGHHMIRLWHLQSGTFIDLNHQSSGVTAVAFSRDDCMIASCSLGGSIWLPGAQDFLAETVSKYNYCSRRRCNARDLLSLRAP